MALFAERSPAGDQTPRGDQTHWAFRPVERPNIPAACDSALVRNPIDAFLLARLEREGLSFSPPAPKRDLLRRAKFDLLGLPPTPDEIDEFLADEAPDAYERLIDSLLASPHYGEHWGRHWLDVVRYAETAGYNADPLRPLAWKYRDYVIRAFNDDVPYDRFVEEQLAGDELFPDDPEAVLATGYTLLWPDESNASNILLARQDSLNDLTANVGAVFLGVSIGCAQCHDHKFDPLPQRDFYRLQAFFSGIVRNDKSPIGTPDQLALYQDELAVWLEQTAALREELHQLELPARVKASGERRMKFPSVVLDAIDAAPENRTAYQRQLAFWSERQMDIKEETVAAILSDDQKKRRAELRTHLAEWERKRPQPPAEVAGMIVGELEQVPPPTHLLAAGSYNKPLEEVSPGFLSVISFSNAESPVVSPRLHTSGRRSALARWLTRPENPLVPRVIVNRIWQGHFGRGLVDNANDFGTQTPPPSHPELLDWLSSEFIRDWSLKSLHRLILTSSAYRQSTDRRSAGDERPHGDEVDPANRLYWHFDRQRLTAESVRDSLLSVAGLRETSVYGPSVYPALPPDFSKREAWKVSSHRADRFRRSVYIHAKRNLPYPLLEAFDLPDMHESCARRSQTTVAPQALMLLNSDLVLEFAQAFAGRLLSDNPHAELRPLIQSAYLLAFSRRATDGESAAAESFIARQQALFESDRRPDRPLLLPRGFPKFLDVTLAAAITDFCHALLNANEFLYVE
ncbi:MAG TPA: DUF1549 and DUF1553 domain-containing protein [Planctomycetaceae bacterium]|nr:DUF1549 and DUF1553 domain-containing protein [Planctomycetaceae bacterium]